MIKERLEQFNNVNNWINKNYHIAETLKLSELVSELKEFDLDMVDRVKDYGDNKIYHNYESILKSNKDEDIIKINLDLYNLNRVYVDNLSNQIIINNYLNGDIDIQNNLGVIISSHTFLPNRLSQIIKYPFKSYINVKTSELFKTLFDIKTDNTILITDYEIYCRELTNGIKEVYNRLGYKYKEQRVGIFLYPSDYVAYNSEFKILKQNYTSKAYQDILNVVLRDIKFNILLNG